MYAATRAGNGIGDSGLEALTKGLLKKATALRGLSLAGMPPVCYSPSSPAAEIVTNTLVACQTCQYQLRSIWTKVTRFFYLDI